MARPSGVLTENHAPSSSRYRILNWVTYWTASPRPFNTIADASFPLKTPLIHCLLSVISAHQAPMAFNRDWLGKYSGLNILDANLSSMPNKATGQAECIMKSKSKSLVWLRIVTSRF